jgi:hypothetical protein
MYFSHTSPLKYLYIILNPSPASPLVTVQVKVSYLTPEERSPGWMGNGDGRGTIEGLG